MQLLDKGFELSVDRQRRLVRFRPWGRWEVEDAARFKVAFRRNQADLGPGPFQIFVDLLHFPAQQPEVTELIKAEFRYAADQGLTRAGHAVATTQFQIRRTGSGSQSLEFGFFATEAEALAWLDQHAAAV